MSWQDRIREAVYQSPSGLRISFSYEDVRMSFDKKTTAFNFPDANGTYVQDTGHTGDRHPMRLFFWGANHDLEADYFISLLKESGQGVLEHPFYGKIDVVPFGQISRRDDLKTAANQTIFDVQFWQTTGLIYPSSQSDPASDVLRSVDEFNDAQAAEFSELTELDNTFERSSLRNNYQSLLDNAEIGLRSVAETQSNVEDQFNAINDSINRGIDVLISDPLTLAFQTTQLLQAPARALTNVRARLSAYGDLANSIISGDGAVVTAGNDSRNSNAFQTRNLFSLSYVTGSIISVVNNEFTTKPEALEAAETILNQFSDVIAWRDANYNSLNQIDSGAAYQQLQEAVAIAAGFLVEISFTLKQESRIKLSRSRTIIDLVAELYDGDIDEQLDFFIASNNLSGSEILELPKGREIVYYI